MVGLIELFNSWINLIKNFFSSFLLLPLTILSYYPIFSLSISFTALTSTLTAQSLSPTLTHTESTDGWQHPPSQDWEWNLSTIYSANLYLQLANITVSGSRSRSTSSCLSTIWDQGSGSIPKSQKLICKYRQIAGMEWYLKQDIGPTSSLPPCHMSE